MLDHVGIQTRNLETLVEFYASTLLPLGYEKVFSNEEGAAFGKDGIPELWLVRMPGSSGKANLGFRAGDRIAVDDFYSKALQAGASSDRGPALRPQYHQSHYAAYVVDPDGNTVSAVCHEPAVTAHAQSRAVDQSIQ
jgi:catechol 2,3-dioxygenase-like lactoylglutathione lyase family enzyme